MGGPVLRYSGLTATDAQGHILRSWLELHGGRMLVRVDARGAHYPLRIDPLIQHGPKLACPPSTPGSCAVVALSSDGNTALVGNPAANSGDGAVSVFTRSGEEWTEQAKLTAGADSGAFFGESVALSADGNTALIGGFRDNGFVGAAWVFTRSGATWTQQGAKLTGGESGTAYFGGSVALSSDGDTALIGAPRTGQGSGAAWVFVRSGEEWTNQAKFTAVERSADNSATAWRCR